MGFPENFKEKMLKVFDNNPALRNLLDSDIETALEGVKLILDANPELVELRQLFNDIEKSFVSEYMAAMGECVR